MLQNIYLHLVILCGVFYHGIIAKLADVDTRESSGLLLREKRVISHLPGGLTPTLINEANYMVNIKQNNRLVCAGAILTHHTVITAAPCLKLNLSHYDVYSGSGDDRYNIYHTVKSKLSHFGNLPHDEFDGITLLTVDPPFVFTYKTGNIHLHVGSLPVGTVATITGWGITCPAHPIPKITKRLRTINVPIMNHQECQNIYHGRFNITEKYICTYDANQHCALTDIGTPLVVNNMMAGIHVWMGHQKTSINPDVFLNLQRADYSEWIREHMLLN